jgi:hypothetical protein
MYSIEGYTGHHRKPKVIKMKKPDGSLASNAEESAKVFKDNLEQKVFNRNKESIYDDSIFNEIDPVPCDPKLGGETVTSSEIQRAIKKMKTEKAPG